MKYPIHKHEVENVAEEDRCLDRVRDIISERLGEGKPVGAIIIEPITNITNSMASPRFYRHLRKIASEEGIPFIVDETRTGVGKTGKFWAHEHWYLDDAPDIITFGTSAEISGVFTTPEFRPLEANKLTNISNGSSQKIVAFKAITEFMKKKSLLERVDDTSAFIKAELDRINKKKQIFKNLRGYGTYLGWDTSDYESARNMQKYLLRNGILTRVQGDSTVCMRPALTLKPRQAAVLRDVLMDY